MVKNYYYLIVGILSILFSFTHAWNGHTHFLPALDASGLTLAVKTTGFYVWHILTVENLIFGVAFLVMSTYKDASKVKFTARIIVILMIARLAVIVISTLLRNKNDLQATLTDSIAIIIFIGLILLGIRKGGKVPA